MERMGKEPDPDKFPLEDWEFPLEVQQAIYIHAFYQTNGTVLQALIWAKIGVPLQNY